MSFSWVIFLYITIVLHCTNAKENTLKDLLQRGKSIFSRSYASRQYGDPNYLAPEHREKYDGIEMEENSIPWKSDYSNLEQQPPKKELGHSQHSDKGYRVTYHTEVVQKDNMDLYGLIGGLSFASLLATTLFILSRRNGGIIIITLTGIYMSLDEIYRSDDDSTYRRNLPSKYRLQKDDIVTKLKFS